MNRLAAFFLLLCSCSLAIRRGNDLYEQRDFLGAVEAYDEAVVADPSNKEALALRDQARTQALSVLLADSAQATREKHFSAAATTLGKAFGLADKWARPGTGAAELDLLTKTWLEDFGTKLETEGPLKHIATRALLPQLLTHPRFAPLDAALGSAWSGAMSARCDRALAEAKTPFLAALTKAYCQAGGRAVQPAAPALPLFSQSPRIEDFVRGAAGSWPVTMTQAFDASPWAWRASQQHANVSVSGQLEAQYSDRRVIRTAHWTVQVPYTVTNYVSVPYTTYQYYSYPCGKSTCSGSRPVTNYRSEPRTHTQYRTEARQVDYPATESKAELTASVNMFVDLRPHGTVLGTVLRENKVETGITHSGVAVAGLQPETAHLPSKADWDTRMRSAAHARLLAALIEHWRDNYCNPPLADAEAAARCVFSGRSNPDERAVLNALFRDDLDRLVLQSRFGLSP